MSAFHIETPQGYPLYLVDDDGDVVVVVGWTSKAEPVGVVLGQGTSRPHVVANGWRAFTDLREARSSAASPR